MQMQVEVLCSLHKKLVITALCIFGAKIQKNNGILKILFLKYHSSLKMVEIFHNFIPQSHYTLASAQLMSKNVNSLGLKTIRANLEFPDFALKINTRGQFFARIFQNALFCSNYLIATRVTSN